MHALTEQQILQATPAASLSLVRSVNVWGAGIQDITILEKCTHVEILSLSHNRIKSLKALSRLKHIQELYLRKNQIATFLELRHLQRCADLKILWLAGNPCVKEEPNYRVAVAGVLPQLVKIDDVDITEAERIQGRAYWKYQEHHLTASSPTRSASPISPMSSVAIELAQAMPSPTPLTLREATASPISGKSNILSAILLMLRELDDKERTIVRRALNERF